MPRVDESESQLDTGTERRLRLVIEAARFMTQTAALSAPQELPATSRPPKHAKPGLDLNQQ